MQGGDVDPFIGSRPKGIIQMAAADLFERIEASGTRDWVIKASFFEIYNEEVRDLLVPDDNDSLSSICSHSCLPILSVREDSAGHVRVKAYEEVVTSVQDVSRILRKGNAHRACASTARNSRSSRSHAIFRLFIESRAKIFADDDSHTVRTSTLNLVDLAGSEDGSATTGTRKREGGKINQSLLALTRVIQSLGLPEKKRPKYIGYRDSKLTRILKPSLQGEACVAIICCASPMRVDVEETRSTLKFAASAKLIKINPTVNEVSDTAVSKLKDELSTLKQALSALQERLRQQREMENRPTPPPPIRQELPPVRQPAPNPFVTGTPLASGHFEMMEPSARTDASTEGSVERDTPSSGGSADDGPPPPVREVAVLLESHPTTTPATTTDATISDAEARANFLQDKLNASYDVVAGLVKDLQQARGMINHVHSQNLNLQERMVALEEEIKDRKTEDSSISPWMYGVGAFLYAFELNQFLLAALLYIWLSQNFVAADVIESSSSRQRNDDESISKLDVLV